MKKLILVITICFGMSINAQDVEIENVKSTIDTFFDAFHKQDTTAMRAMAKGDILMQSVSVNKEGKTVLNENSYNDFLRNIASIPEDRSFEEKILDYSIQIDGKMANAWTPYEFWYMEKLSHCGVNSFQLIKEEDNWKIIYLVDTRRREGCSE
ncbi:nuclear transport factor 2 family protein [Winogradskyella alexanderae]|uniref:Nuclear transport factor 2 family protein n=1 Tax=Winogradskyella alexanderae TaxID=2877123 RepID=A0ABS7XT42_9FLAO|nr:nuclear transport factor 2 family protein [Winogradskyella alexanderae]MCA0133188.1 nuclear transport factor 2 family protein [Winogradskyella alexanderae]